MCPSGAPASVDVQQGGETDVDMELRTLNLPLEPSRELWDLVKAEEGPEAAWQAVVAVLLTTLGER